MFGLVPAAATTSTTARDQALDHEPGRRNTPHPPDERRVDTNDCVTASVGIAKTRWTLDLVHPVLLHHPDPGLL
jgi:hypothetical protein